MPFKEVEKQPAKKNKNFEFGLFSPKALDFLDNSNAFINIASGAVRSGKSITVDCRWLDFLGESKHDEFMMSGKTRDTLERNVINPIIKMIDGNLQYKYNKFDGIFEIEDKTCWCIGFNDEGVTNRIRGMTIGGWYADEIATATKNAVEMAISRCSLEDAKMFWTTNPDSPYHYIYTDYINNQELLSTGTVKVFNFLLNDNLNLTNAYKDHLKRVNSKSEVFYKRNILGQWVIAEGAIYDHFSESENVFNTPINIKDYNEILLGCDYGVSTVCVFGVMGVKKNSAGNHYYLLDEWYYDAQEQGLSKSDSEYCDIIVKLQNKYHIKHGYLPHDAKSLKTAAEKDSRITMKIDTYAPDTHGDIETIQNLINNNQFHIHSQCKNSITQAQTYCWDSKAQARGEDKPLKINDHCPDMWRGPILGPMKNAVKTAGIGIIKF